VPHKKLGKLIFALDDRQLDYLRGLEKHCASLPGPVPLEFLSGQRARELEPDLSPECTGALLSTETGIIDSHAYMDALERDITETGGELVYGTKVVRIDRAEPPSGKSKRGDGSDEGWVVQTVSKTEDGEGEPSAFLAKAVVNSAGLS
jgi:2-hydroxyglutarate dehydrogenase